jgi:hypothetical protein
MASVYPGSLDNFATNRADATTMATTHKDDHNNANDAINKIEAELGTSPSGSSATVAARFAVIQDTSDAYTISGHSVDRALTAASWNAANANTDRSYDANSYTMDELADVLASLSTDFVEARNVLLTLIDDLQDRGIIG